MAIVTKESAHCKGFRHVDLNKTPVADLIIIRWETFRYNLFKYTMFKIPAIVILKGIPQQLHVNNRGGYHLTNFEGGY